MAMIEQYYEPLRCNLVYILKLYFLRPIFNTFLSTYRSVLWHICLQRSDRVRKEGTAQTKLTEAVANESNND